MVNILEVLECHLEAFDGFLVAFFSALNQVKLMLIFAKSLIFAVIDAEILSKVLIDVPYCVK